MEEKPYLFEEIVVKKRVYNPKYGDDRLCKCGHSYYRHFDSYENMQPIGCKYCDCFVFMQKEGEI
jgi:hypothetical protein